MVRFIVFMMSGYSNQVRPISNELILTIDSLCQYYSVINLDNKQLVVVHVSITLTCCKDEICRDKTTSTFVRNTGA